jgi:hypothetical protein
MTMIATVVAQLVGQSPVLLVYAIGVVVATSYLPRYRGPASLTLIASGALLAVAILQVFVFQYFVQARTELGWDSARFNWMIGVVSIASNLVRAAATGLLLAAVFVGRAPAPTSFVSPST